MGERRKRRMSVEGWIDPIFAPGFYIAPVGDSSAIPTNPSATITLIGPK